MQAIARVDDTYDQARRAVEAMEDNAAAIGEELAWQMGRPIRYARLTTPIMERLRGDEHPAIVHVLDQIRAAGT